MSRAKKKFRKDVEKLVLDRDGHKCRVCGRKPKLSTDERLDVHHIWPRNKMPYQGYVTENLIPLCTDCHYKAELYLQGRSSTADCNWAFLYSLIGSSFEEAWMACKKCEANTTE